MIAKYGPKAPTEDNLLRLEEQADALARDYEARDSTRSIPRGNVDDPFIVHESATQIASTKPDNYWKSKINHPRLIALGTFALFLLVISVVVNVSIRPSAIGNYKVVVGIVEACGVISVSKIAGGSEVIASIRVPDGSLVPVRVDSGTPVAKGTHVVLRRYATGAYQLEHPL